MLVIFLAKERWDLRNEEMDGRFEPRVSKSQGLNLLKAMGILFIFVCLTELLIGKYNSEE